MAKRMCCLAVIAAIVAGWAMFGQAREQAPKPVEKKPDKAKVKELMTRKLEHSQKLFAALVMNDLVKAGKEAEELMRVRKEAAWAIVKTDTYQMWSKEFDLSAEQIIKATKEKNYDAAKLRYLELTTACFHCHAYVRDLGDIKLEDSEIK